MAPDDAASLDGLVAAVGLTAPRLVPAIDAVLEGADLAEVVQRSALPRRLVERLMRLDADRRDLASVAERLRPAARSLDADSVERMRRLIEAAPAADRRLDHVSATAETAVERAALLTSRYHLSGRRIVMLGDHDLTALAIAPHLPDSEIVVVDVDEHLLAYIDVVAREQRLAITCVYADLTVALPESVRNSAHLVFTDPPYTPAGVATFLARSIEAVDASQPSRITMAYGFSTEQPSLGLQVQREIVALELAIESIEPDVHRYSGAQAIGSTSDHYTLLTTTRSLSAASKRLTAVGQAIYTHGDRSIETDRRTVDSDAAEALAAHLAVGPPAWSRATDIGWVGFTDRESAPVANARELFDRLTQRRVRAVAASLIDGSDAWLARTLLRTTADRLVLLVRNSHPDLVDAASQRSLQRLVEPTYRVKLLRSQPSPGTAIVVAERVATPVPSVLDRPGAKVSSALHDAIYKGSRVGGGDGVSKAAASERVDEVIGELGRGYAGVRVGDLPRAVLERLAEITQPA